MIEKQFGSSQIQTTARYAHPARNTVKDSAARINDSIDKDLDAVSHCMRRYRGMAQRLHQDLRPHSFRFSRHLT